MPEEAAAGDLTARVAEVATSVPAAESPGLSTETGRQLEATLHRAARAASVPAPTVVTTMADRQGAIPHAEAPVWERVPAEEDLVVGVVVAGTGVAADVASPSLGSPGLGMVPGGW